MEKKTKLMRPKKLLRLLLNWNFDAIFVRAKNVVAVVVKTRTSPMTTLLGNPKMALVNHVSEKVGMVIPLANLVTTIRPTSPKKPLLKLLLT